MQFQPKHDRGYTQEGQISDYNQYLDIKWCKRNYQNWIYLVVLLSVTKFTINPLPVFSNGTIIRFRMQNHKLKCLCSFTIELKYGIFKSYFIQIEEIEPKMKTSSF